MPDVVLYIAASLDGFIATSEGDIDWLPLIEADQTATNQAEMDRAAGIDTLDYGYADFYATVDAVLMGRRTYEQVLSFGEWPYADKPCWVCSRRPVEVTRANVIVTAQSPEAALAAMADSGLQRVWLVGGANLIAAFREAGLIQEYILSIIPYLLGKGIPLFVSPGSEEPLKLIETTTFPDGVVQLRYRSIPLN